MSSSVDFSGSEVERGSAIGCMGGIGVWGYVMHMGGSAVARTGCDV